MCRVISLQVGAPSYADNRVGEPTAREVRVLLPPEYDTGSTRYPLLILLHGFGLNSGYTRLWFGGGYCPGLDVAEISRRLYERGAIEPMIVVCPDGGTWLGGGMWEDSPVSGGAASFVSGALLRYVDQHFRTDARPERRGIAGHSMGGQGAIKIAMQHPGMFGAVYSMSGMMSFQPGELRRYAAAWARCPHAEQPASDWDEMARAYLAMCMAYCWKTDAEPHYVCFPVVEGRTPRRIDTTASRRFFAAWPAAIFQRSRSARNALRRLNGLALDIGIDDEFESGRQSVRRFVRDLQTYRIPFTYEEYSGDHSSALADRLEYAVLPFFSRCFQKSSGSRNRYQIAD